MSVIQTSADYSGGGANMFTGVMMVPLVFLFGSLAQAHNVFSAAWMLLPVALLGAAGVLAIWQHHAALHPSDGKPKPLPNALVP